MQTAAAAAAASVGFDDAADANQDAIKNPASTSNGIFINDREVQSDDSLCSRTMAKWLIPPVFVIAVAAVVSMFSQSSLTLEVNADRRVTALLIIDVQNCFTSGGSMAVSGGDDVIPVINGLRDSVRFDVVVATQDWHCPDHVSFASQYRGCEVYAYVNLTYLKSGELCKSTNNDTCVITSHAVNCSSSSDEQVLLTQRLWPDHCIINSTSAELNPKLTTKPSDVIVKKGYHCQIDSYSAFYDNGHMTSTELHTKLSERNVTSVFVVGLATDYCVFYTAKDALGLGYETFVVQDATRGVSESSINSAISQMNRLGIKVINSADVASILSSRSSALRSGTSITFVVAILVLLSSSGRLISVIS